MDMMVAATHGAQLRHEGIQPLAAAARGPAPLDQQVSAQAPALAVTATTASDAGMARVADEKDKRREQQSSDESDRWASSSPNEQGYEHRLVYEDELKRTFIDVVRREDDEDVLMRIPSERLTRYLQDPSSLIDNTSKPGSSSVDVIT